MITLTDTAAVKVRQLLSDEGAEDLALRVAVRPGGCSGFSYEMFFDGDIAADDTQATYGDDGFVRSSSTRHRSNCSKARRSTTRTASTSPGSRSRTRTPPAPAGAARASPDADDRRAVAGEPRLQGSARAKAVEHLEEFLLVPDGVESLDDDAGRVGDEQCRLVGEPGGVDRRCRRGRRVVGVHLGVDEDVPVGEVLVDGR